MVGSRLSSTRNTSKPKSLTQRARKRTFLSILAAVSAKGFPNYRATVLDTVQATLKINENYDYESPQWTTYWIERDSDVAMLGQAARIQTAMAEKRARKHEKRVRSPSPSSSVCTDSERGDEDEGLEMRLSELNFPMVPGTEKLVQRIQNLHDRKATDVTLYWAVLETKDKESMALLGADVQQHINGILKASLSSVLLKPSTYASRLLDADRWSQTTISEIVNRFMLDGVRDIWEGVSNHNDPSEATAASRDQDVRYILKCFQAMAAYIAKYASGFLGERPFDVQAALSFAELPGVPKLTYGDMMSTADQSEKMERSGVARRGKNVAFLHTIANREHGCGENSGPQAKPHLKHARGDYISLAKTSRAQIRGLIAHRGSVADKILVPSFHIMDRIVSFYVTVQFSPELYVMHEVFEERLRFPREDGDVQDVLNLCTAFLSLRSIMVNTANALRGNQAQLRIRRLSSSVEQLNAIAGKETPVKQKKKVGASAAKKGAGSSLQSGPRKKAKTRETKTKTETKTKKVSK
ncbi:hypothetical protein BDZ88DRAFT_409064 [Geranomyces variabilis]|nr:hypothetical protein BDZ88DRAFT_409064 [Geranomyces variabilis]KAJ3139879.1 hypothetical protein HDU90_008777 [Geranomyces variabilis]